MASFADTGYTKSGTLLVVVDLIVVLLVILALFEPVLVTFANWDTKSNSGNTGTAVYTDSQVVWKSWWFNMVSIALVSAHNRFCFVGASLIVKGS